MLFVLFRFLCDIHSADALKSSIMNVTGPLIRVLGERFSTDIKVAILETLSTFMGKVNKSIMNIDLTCSCRLMLSFE
jgi:hypothetical protein